jgi:hypothetical protein
MAVILQVDFPFQGPFGEQMAEQLQGLLNPSLRNQVLSGRSGQKMKQSKLAVAFTCLKAGIPLKPIWRCTVLACSNLAYLQ